MSILSSIDVKKYSKKFDTMGVGCDYLRLSYLNSSEFIQEKIDLLDYDNSNFGHCEFQNMIFTFQKIPTSLGIALTFSCSYNDVSVPVFQFVKFENSAAYITGKWGKLDFYGSFFRLSDLGLYNLDNLISEICVTINEEENPIVTRYDYRIDYFSRFNSVPVSHWSKVIDITSQTKVDPKYTGDVLTNWLVGTKKTGTYCVRLYDKLLDSDLKEKYFLYHDYFDYESVHRLEFEFQRNFLKGYHLSDYFDGIIQKKIESILGINDDLRSGAICYKYDTSKEITEKNKSSYIRRYNTMTKKLAKNKINPFLLSYEFLYEELESQELEDMVKEFLNTYIKQERKNLHNKFTH